MKYYYMLIFLLLIPTAQAETVIIKPINIGAVTCTQMVEDYSAGYDGEYVAYIAGYMTAVDVFNGGKPMTYAAPETIARAVLTICKTKRRAKADFATIAAGVHQRAVRRDRGGSSEMVRR